MEDLLNIALNFNEKCNLKCKYCFIDQTNSCMTQNRAKQIIEYASKLRAKNKIISFTTAEPLIDWPLVKETIEYAQQKNFNKFCIATNGILLTKEIIEYFNKNNIRPQLSYDGFKKKHDSIRFLSKNQRLSKKLEKTLNLLKDNLNVHLELRITYTPETVNYIYETVKYLTLKFKNKDVRINICPVVYKTKWDSKNLILFEGQLKKIANLFLEYYHKNILLNIGYSECFPAQHQLVNIYKYKDSPEMFCNVGHKLISVDKDGKIWPCYWLGSSKFKQKEDLCLGNIFDKKLNIQNFKKIAYPKQNPCLSCRVWNYLIKGDSTKPLEAYKKFYDIWLNTSKYVNEKIEKPLCEKNKKRSLFLVKNF